MNKREREAYERYLRSDMLTLYDAYDRFSRAKEEAWEYCKTLKDQKAGRGLKVIGASTHFFSAGFLYEEDGKPMFMYITHGSDTPVDLSKEGE